MSRSYRKPVIKDRGRDHRWYNKVYRTNWSRITRGITSYTDDDKDNVYYPHKNTFINQWDICDWTWNFIGNKLGKWHEDWRKRLTRK